MRRGQVIALRPMGWLPPAAVWVVSALYMGLRLDRGWVPMDEGTLGHSAERVLHGELPHRDYDELYTGGLAQLDALVFRIAGTQLIALRVAMFVVFLLWVPTVYYIARRFAGAWASAVVTLLCVVWSIATYPAAMPSAYTLFLATFGTAALIRFTETRHTRWLVAAGIAGGLSVIIKIVGLYYIAAALLFLAFDEHRTAGWLAPGDAGPVPGPRGRRVYAGMVAAGAALFVVALLVLVRPIPGWSRLVHFVLPGALLAGLLAAMERRSPGWEGWANRLRRLFALVVPFAAGVALPVTLFMAPYAATGSLGALVKGVFAEPLDRYRYSVLPPTPLRTLPAALAWLLLLTPRSGTTAAPGSRSGARIDWLILAAYVVILSALVITAAHGGRPYVGVWMAISYAAPCTVAAGFVLLVDRMRRGVALDMRSEQLWLLLCMTAMCSLIQVPYANWGNIQYFAPITILALLGVVTTRPTGAGPRAAIVAGFLLVFAVAAVNPAHLSVADGAERGPETWPGTPLPIPRTGLRSGADAAADYARVVELLRAHTRPGGFIYAAPDCPELYYLSGLGNPTRTLFDFFDDSAAHDAEVLRRIDARRVTAVAINTSPGFSAPMDTTLLGALRWRFPDSAVVNRFVVRWARGS